MLTALILFHLLIGYVYLTPTFKIAVVVQSTVWPNVTVKNETIDNGLVRLEIYGNDIVEGQNIMHVTSKACELVTSGSVDGLIMFVDCTTAEILEHQAVFRHLPNIVVVRHSCYMNHHKIFHWRPSCFYTNSLLAEIVAHEKWYTVLLYHDETVGKKNLSNGSSYLKSKQVTQLDEAINTNSRCIMDVMRKHSVQHVSTRIVNTTTYGPQQCLKYLSQYQQGGVIVLGTSDTITNILLQAREDNLLNRSWILMTGNTQLSVLNGSDIANSHIVFLRQQFQNSISNQENCVDSFSSEMEYQVYLSDVKSWYLDVFSLVATQHSIATLEPLNCHHQTPLQYRTVVMETARSKYQEKENSIEICSTVSTSNNSLKHMGQWSSNAGLSLKRNIIYGNDFVDFGNATLKIAALPLSPFVFFTVDENNNTHYSGFCIDILDELSVRFKFNYEIVSPIDNSYGSLEEDGTWNGMVGMVMRSEAEFAAGPFTITSARETVIDFTTTYMEEGGGILTKRPQEEELKEYKVFKPLSLKVWIVICAAMIVVGISMFIVNKFSPFSKKEDITARSNKRILSSSTWLIYSSFVEQGDEQRPISASGRIMLSFWWIFTILMLATYTANLAAYLTVTIIASPINSLEELADHNEIKPLIFSGSNLHTLFKTSKSNVYQKIWNKMNGMPIVNELDDALKYVREDHYAFITDYSLLDYIMLQDCQTYAIADEKFNSAGLGFVLKENAEYLNSFNLGIMKMTEAGLIEKWRNEWWLHSDSCSSSDRSGSAHSLGLDSILGLFYFYFGVVGVAVVLFIIELLCQSKTFKEWLAVIYRDITLKINILIDKRSNNSARKDSLIK